MKVNEDEPNVQLSEQFRLAPPSRCGRRLTAAPDLLSSLSQAKVDSCNADATCGVQRDHTEHTISDLEREADSRASVYIHECEMHVERHVHACTRSGVPDDMLVINGAAYSDSGRQAMIAIGCVSSTNCVAIGDGHGELPNNGLGAVLLADLLRYQELLVPAGPMFRDWHGTGILTWRAGASSKNQPRGVAQPVVLVIMRDKHSSRTSRLVINFQLERKVSVRDPETLKP
jgi:hypothetical protein